MKMQIESTVKIFSRDELEQIIIEHSKTNREFRAYVLRRAPIDPSQNVKELYAIQIQECIDAAADRNGFIGYSETRQAVVAAYELLKKAEEYIAQQKYEYALPIAQAVIETVYPALQGADDSNGNIGGATASAWEVIHTIAAQIQPKSALAETLFTYCLEEVGKKQYEGWSVYDEFFPVAEKLVHTEQQMQQLFTVLDDMLVAEADTAYSSDYVESVILNTKIDVYKRLGKHVEVEELLQKNMHITSVRDQAIEQAIKKKEYETAKTLVKEGLQRAQSDDNHGGQWHWNEWLLDIAQRQKDISTQRNILRDFFSLRQDMEYYDQLKKTYHGSKEWSAVVEDILRQLRKDNHWSTRTVLEIYKQEDRWEDFLQVIQKTFQEKTRSFSSFDTRLELLEQYHKDLAAHFPEQLIQLYAYGIRQSLQPTTGRGHYQYVCKILRRMRTLGGDEEVQRIIAESRQQYKNRRALLEELNKVI